MCDLLWKWPEHFLKPNMNLHVLQKCLKLPKCSNITCLLRIDFEFESTEDERERMLASNIPLT